MAGYKTRTLGKHKDHGAQYFGVMWIFRILGVDLSKLVTSKKEMKTTEKLLLYFYDQQEYAGQYVDGYFTGDLTSWFQNYNEYSFYLNELRNKGLLDIFTKDLLIRLTHDGVNLAESLLKVEEKSIELKDHEQYDIALSFAGEQREFVNEVANHLESMGLKVFYDKYEVEKLWGKDLYQYLNDLYKNRCKYCIVFVSKEYAKKLWTKHELKSAQERAFKENREYILPIRFDNTDLPGLNTTIGHLSTDQFKPLDIAKIAKKKVRELLTSGPSSTPTKMTEYSISIRGTFSYDLDLGIQEKQSSSDIFWEQVTETDRYLTPLNGCGLCVLGQIAEFDKIDTTFLEKLTYSQSKVNGHDDARNQIPDNTIIAFKTKGNQYGLLRINEYGYNLQTTYKVLE